MKEIFIIKLFILMVLSSLMGCGNKSSKDESKDGSKDEIVSVQAPSLWSEPVRVLSIDGGGVRGIIPAVILEKMEEELGRPVSKIFDMVAGSSTGGLLALGLTAPKKNNQATRAKDAVSFYFEQSPKIFSSSWRHWLKNLGGLLGPKYESTGIYDLTLAQFQDLKISQALVPTLITGYHIVGESGVEFFSEDAKKYPKDRDCLMRQVAMATAAAPIFFDVVDVEFSWGKLVSVTDGSLYAHNPALIAYINAKKFFKNRPIEVYSLGTGLLSPEQLRTEIKGRGLLQWLSPIVDHVQIGGTEADTAVLHKLLNEGDEENFFRLNIAIDQAHTSTDDTSSDNLYYLYQRGIVATNTKIFKAIVKRLKGQRD